MVHSFVWVLVRVKSRVVDTLSLLGECCLICDLCCLCLDPICYWLKLAELPIIVLISLI